MGDHQRTRRVDTYLFASTVRPGVPRRPAVALRNLLRPESLNHAPTPLSTEASPMVDQRPARSRGFLKPVVGGLIVIAVLIAVIFFRSQVWEAAKSIGSAFGNWVTNWVPDHP